MSNPQRHPEQFAPHNPDEKQDLPDANKKQMQTKDNEQPKYVQPKGK